MKRYQVTLNGISGLLMHKDNLTFAEKVSEWVKEPENKGLSKAGDDRTPAWIWLGYMYHDGKHIGIESDNLMTMLREGGAKITLSGKQTYKKQTQSGIIIDQQQWDLLRPDGSKYEVDKLSGLIGNNTFLDHVETAEREGFELLVKRVIVGRNKHVRVRPLFRQWSCTGSLTVIDEELSGITKSVLEKILNQAGAICGLCDWRPSSPNSGSFGKFSSIVEEI